jgi:hypothetical protein
MWPCVSDLIPSPQTGEERWWMRSKSQNGINDVRWRAYRTGTDDEPVGKYQGKRNPGAEAMTIRTIRAGVCVTMFNRLTNPADPVRAHRQKSMEATLTDYLQSQDDLVREAALALPHQFTQCTYPLGALRYWFSQHRYTPLIFARQAVYLCLTCPENRGLCSACSVACHTNHEQLEL